ncbi:septum formation family protein [Mycobacterium kansasii]|uniref:Septum formation family protein n=1 Tax=Mycobacterium kansasii TaxID=1768 RepID=A0A1V3WXY9_MYCKA|nr:septum formation family protein [Mycobacterium kansasii]
MARLHPGARRQPRAGDSGGTRSAYRQCRYCRRPLWRRRWHYRSLMTFQPPPYPPPAQPRARAGTHNNPATRRLPAAARSVRPGLCAASATAGHQWLCDRFADLRGPRRCPAERHLRHHRAQTDQDSRSGRARHGNRRSGAVRAVDVTHRAAIIAAVVSNDGSVRATSLAVGDCIESIPGDNARVATLPKVSCAKPHEGEVYAQLRVTASSFPGQSSLESDYRERCLSAFAGYAPNAADSEDFESYVLYPTQATWNHGDRDVVCIATTKVKRTGSIKG